MSIHNALNLLEAELRGHPDRDSAVDLYRHVLDLARRIQANDRAGLVGALDAWLKQRSEPRTMIAVDVAGRLSLAELRDVLDQLLEEVCAGRAFLPHYAQWIDEAIQAMS